jgi:hypothetical protein
VGLFANKNVFNPKVISAGNEGDLREIASAYGLAMTRQFTNNDIRRQAV